MPVHTYTNWNQRPSDQEEQIEPFRKYFFICEGANTETFYFKHLIDLRKELGIHPLIDIRLWEKTEEDKNISFAKRLVDFAEEQKMNPDNGFDADIGHDIRPVGVVEPETESESNYDYLGREEEHDDDEDDDKRFGGAGYNTLHQNYDPDDDYAGFDDTDLPEGTVSEHMINAKLNGEADELKKRYEVDELQEEIADELKDAKTKRKGRGRRFK